jgi:hypothetical protein
VEEVGLGQPVAYTDHEKRLIATHEAGHATIAWLVAPSAGWRCSPSSSGARRWACSRTATARTSSPAPAARCSAFIQIAFGGQVAEELFFGDISTGPGGDLLYATNVAAQMVGAVGMTDTLISFGAVQGSAFSDTNLVGRVLGDPDGRARVEDILQQQKQRAHSLLEANRHLVEALRDALLERHELDRVGDHRRARGGPANGPVARCRSTCATRYAPPRAEGPRLQQRRQPADDAGMEQVLDPDTADAAGVAMASTRLTLPRGTRPA